MLFLYKERALMAFISKSDQQWCCMQAFALQPKGCWFKPQLWLSVLLCPHPTHVISTFFTCAFNVKQSKSSLIHVIHMVSHVKFMGFSCKAVTDWNKTKKNVIGWNPLNRSVKMKWLPPPRRLCFFICGGLSVCFQKNLKIYGRIFKMLWMQVLT